MTIATLRLRPPPPGYQPPPATDVPSAEVLAALQVVNLAALALLDALPPGVHDVRRAPRAGVALWSALDQLAASKRLFTPPLPADAVPTDAADLWAIADAAETLRDLVAKAADCERRKWPASGWWRAARSAVENLSARLTEPG